MATPKAGIGTLLQMGDGASPEVFTSVARVRNISGPGKKANTYDSTTHDSTDNYAEFVAGLKSGGEVTFEILFDVNDSGHVAFDAAFEARALKNWKIVIANASPAKHWAFAGLITTLNYGYPVDGLQTASCTIQVSGPATLN